MFDQPLGRKTRVAIDIAASGDNTVISAPSAAGTHYELDHIYFITASSVLVKFKDGSTDMTGSMSFGANGTYAFDNGSSLFPVRLSAGNGFVINLGGAVQVSGWVLYRVVNE